MPVDVRLLGRFVTQHLRALDRDRLHFLAAHAEHDATPCGADRIVEVDDRRMRALQALKAGLDQVAARLCQHLDLYILGDAILLDQAGDEIEFGRAGRREADLDLLQADLHQQIEEAGLLFRIHRVDQRLVAVAKVGRQPARGAGDHLRRPGAVRHVDGREGAVLGRWIAQHGWSASLEGRLFVSSGP